jgi:uncharacterized membrane protein
MQHLNTRRIVVAGVMSAIAIFFGATGLGYIPWFSGVSITIMVVPVVIAAVLEGPVVGLIVGFVFGVTSLIQAAVAPKSPLDPIFVYPWISVLPRLVIGPIAWVVYASVKKISTSLGKTKEAFALILGGAAGSLINSILVLGLLGIFYLGYEGMITWPVIGSAFVTNGLPEAAAAAVFTVAVVSAWKGIEYGRKKSKLSDEMENSQ